MRKKVRKITAIILTVAMAFSIVTPAFADDEMNEEVITTFSTNEYDTILKIKQQPLTINESQYTEEELSAMQNYSPEQVLLERAQLSDEELYNLGYAAEQIAILRTYDGSPLEDNPQMRAVMATMEGNITRLSYSSNAMQVRLDWEWSNAPTWRGTAINDKVVCGFVGVNTSNVATIVKADTLNCTVNYFLLDGEGLGPVTFVPTTPDVYGHAEVSIPTVHGFTGDKFGWAKSGSFTIAVKEKVTMNALDSVAFVFGYGHPTVTVEPSISINFGSTFSGGIGLSFGTTTSEMLAEGVIVNADGSTETINL